MYSSSKMATEISKIKKAKKIGFCACYASYM